MDDIIRLLPDSVANQIAAGEVIQRPASVVKELVENSIDAGATSIQIIVKDAGRTLIQVVDDGIGMSTTDARMAFERHATSKIRQAADLFTLHTMGFRGEALPSIAAVSEIELRTMRRDDTTGTRLILSASKVESQVPDAGVPGTNLKVKNLFFNLPARRKFLKKDTVELNHIVREFERLALVNTSVQFTLIHNDVTLHQLHAGNLKQRICQLFGKNFEHQIIPVETETSLVRINGFISLPANARKRNPLQFFFVNGRYMRHPYFHKAVLKCYEDLIAPDSQPNYFINIVVDPETIDVNIHPQKYEIKFENEQPVWQILSAAIKEALGRFNLSGALDFDSVDVPEIPVFNPDDTLAAPTEDADPFFNPFTEEFATHKSNPVDWEKLYGDFSTRSAEGLEHVRGSMMNTGVRRSAIGRIDIQQETSIPEPEPLLNIEENIEPSLFQLKNRYIVSPSKSGLMLIDQHRAHTLILYEKYLTMLNDGNIATQRLIFRDSVTLDAAQNVTISSIDELLESMGFDISNLGNNTWAINAVPSILGKESPAAALIDIISAVANEDEDIEKSQWQKIAMSMARSAAVKYGTPLKKAEMDSLVSELFRLATPSYTPDGKIVLTTIGMDDINRMF